MPLSCETASPSVPETIELQSHFNASILKQNPVTFLERKGQMSDGISFYIFAIPGLRCLRCITSGGPSEHRQNRQDGHGDEVGDSVRTAFLIDEATDLR